MYDMPDKNAKQRIKKLNKKIQEFEKAYHRMEMRPCKGDKDLKQKDIDLRMLREQIHALERERDSLIYIAGSGIEIKKMNSE